MRYDFLLETYRTELLKTLSVWSQVPDDRMTFRPEPRARALPGTHYFAEEMPDAVADELRGFFRAG